MKRKRKIIKLEKKQQKVRLIIVVIGVLIVCTFVVFIHNLL